MTDGAAEPDDPDLDPQVQLEALRQELFDASEPPATAELSALVLKARAVTTSLVGGPLRTLSVRIKSPTVEDDEDVTLLHHGEADAELFLSSDLAATLVSPEVDHRQAWALLALLRHLTLTKVDTSSPAVGERHRRELAVRYPGVELVDFAALALADLVVYSQGNRFLRAMQPGLACDAVERDLLLELPAQTAFLDALLAQVSQAPGTTMEAELGEVLRSGLGPLAIERVARRLVAAAGPRPASGADEPVVNGVRWVVWNALALLTAEADQEVDRLEESLEAGELDGELRELLDEAPAPEPGPAWQELGARLAVSGRRLAVQVWMAVPRVRANVAGTGPGGPPQAQPAAGEASDRGRRRSPPAHEGPPSLG